MVSKIFLAVALLVSLGEVAQAADCRAVAGKAAARQAVKDLGGNINVGPGYDQVYELDNKDSQHALFLDASAWAVVVGDEVGYSSWVVITSNGVCKVLSVTRTTFY